MGTCSIELVSCISKSRDLVQSHEYISVDRWAPPTEALYALNQLEDHELKCDDDDDDCDY